MNYTPFFSIVLTSYNCSRFILETLKSIENQTYKNFEVIIIDDKSTDNSVNLIKKFIANKKNYIFITNKKNLGVCESRNLGFKRAIGRYICILDSDDLWHKDKLYITYRHIIKTKRDIYCTSYSFIDEESKKIKKDYTIPKNISYKDLLKENFIGCSTTAIKRELFETYQMDSRFTHEDYSFWLKLSRNGYKIEGIRNILVKYRIRKGSRSYNKIISLYNRFLIFKNQEKLPIHLIIYYIFLSIFKGIKKHL